MGIPVENGGEVESVQLMSNAGPSHKRRVHQCCSPHKHETVNEQVGPDMSRILCLAPLSKLLAYIMGENTCMPGPSGGGAFYAPRIKPHPALTSPNHACLSSPFSEKLPLPHHKNSRKNTHQ